MQLLNFLEDETFNRLRTLMGAEKLGQFKLFDPSTQLSYSEREALDSEGLEVEPSTIKILRDKTLAFKNSRVWLQHDASYHLANCSQVQQLRLKFPLVSVGTYQWQMTTEFSQVCLDCLAVLQFAGADARRIRRPEFAEQLDKKFTLASFFEQYLQYPLT